MSQTPRHRDTDHTSKTDAGKTDQHQVPASPPVKEEYPGPQETSTGERLDPGSTEARPDSPEERRGRRRGAS
jgi:hypothetical protein